MKLNPFFFLGFFCGFIFLAGFWETGCHGSVGRFLGVTSPFWDNFHYIAAAVLFAILFYFTLFVFRRVQIEQDVINGQIGLHKRRRNRIYFGCAMCITLTMVAIGGATVSEWYMGSLVP